MKKLTHAEILEQRLSPEESKTIERFPVSIVLDNVRSLYNVGSIFRTADSARVNELVLCGFTPHPPRKEIEKTALGAVDTVPWRYFQNIGDYISECKSNGFKIIAVELADEAINYTDLPEQYFPCSLIFGNELTGISDNVLEQCDCSISIPMYGVKHSLNVSVSVGIAVYEAVRCWQSYK